MSKKILLACAGGFSTSMLVTRMKEARGAEYEDYEILAVPEADIPNHLDSDILLLGPQIAYMLEDLTESFDFPVRCIDSYDYGTMNGVSVFNNALKVLEEAGENNE